MMKDKQKRFKYNKSDNPLKQLDRVFYHETGTNNFITEFVLLSQRYRIWSISIIILSINQISHKMKRIFNLLLFLAVFFTASAQTPSAAPLIKISWVCVLVCLSIGGL